MTVSVPERSWQDVLEGFAAQPGAEERICYLDGFAHGDGAVVTTVTFPRAETGPGHYTVPAKMMSRAGRHFRRLGMRRLAQVHTHGGPGVAHSPRDSHMAYSQMLGAISIVVPHHGRTRPDLDHPSLGVHVRDADGWRRLHPEEVAAVIRTVPSVIDQRSPRWISETSPTATSSPRPGPIRRLLGRLLE